MEQKRDTAIVLRVVPYEDRHRIVTALTENHGRISALARNAVQSRRFGGALDVFSASDWHFVERTGADLYRVEQAQVRRSFDGLRKDFQKLALASVFNELMLKLAPEREVCTELFRLHSNALALVEESDVAGREILYLNVYLIKLLQSGGNQPQFMHCMGCATPVERLATGQSITCVVADAGWICPSCRGQETRHITAREGHHLQKAMIRVSPAALTDAVMAMGLPIRQAPAVMTASGSEHDALHAFLEALFEYHVPGYDRNMIKSLRFLGLESIPRH